MNGNLNFYNQITLFDTLLQIMTMAMVSNDATNNDLMTELQKQNHDYLEKIIENQKQILSILSKLKDMSATD
nr:MAG TPA: hypothetical protein [Caudoviricetes sp.]